MKKNKNDKIRGKIISFFSGVAKIVGLPEVFLYEVLLDEKEKPAALVIGFDEQYVEALFFDDFFNPQESLKRSEKIFSVPVAEHIIGRVINGLGKPIDDFGPLQGQERPIFADAPQIIERDSVNTSLTTGIKVIDTALPIGRGQRQLIIGDRKLGKSTVAMDTVLNQKNEKNPVYCVYVLCGRKKQRLQEMIKLFEKNNAFLYTTIVAATAGASFAELYLAPFVGCAIGEHFRDLGHDVLIVYDDFSQHAKAYRDIALLLERAPGREAYPGDIFSLHASLLERAGRLSKDKGGGSLSALPIIETQEGDITSFIPTNLISITDGQIYFERGLFDQGFLPAVNVGLSVSRIGSQAQPAPLKQVTSGIRLALAQHKELQKLAQLETAKSKEAAASIYRGELLLELLKQDKHTKVTWEEQTVLFYTAEQGHFDDLQEEDWQKFGDLYVQFLRNRHFEMLDKIAKSGLTDDVKEKIKEIALDFKKKFLG